MSDTLSAGSRRDFLSGRVLRDSTQQAGEKLGDQLAESVASSVPEAGETIRLGKQAMACDFDVILNPGNVQSIAPASEALDLIDSLEDQMSVYREQSELSRLNRQAGYEAVPVESRLFELLNRAKTISRETEGGFDPTAGPLVDLWRRCKADGRIPSDSEIDDVMSLIGLDHVDFDVVNRTVHYDQPGVELNLNSIGKGYALDRAGAELVNGGVEDWLLHGGHSSLLARGSHGELGGWPVGIRNPLFPDERLATLLLKNRGMSSSGSGVQFFRHAGRRYGHILDPRTGQPVDGMLSVTVLAPDAALADALSTAFFVIGLEKTREYCHNHEGVGVVLIPPPVQGRRLVPEVFGIEDDVLFFTPEDDSPRMS